jgi:hypothetical protein
MFFIGSYEAFSSSRLVCGERLAAVGAFPAIAGFAARPAWPNPSASCGDGHGNEGPALGWGEDGQEGQALAPSRLGTGTISIAESQRKPLVLTKWPCDERTGSRKIPRAEILGASQR